MDKFNPYKRHIEKLKQGRFNLEEARVLIINLKLSVALGNVTWEQLEISSDELELILKSLQSK